MANNKKWILLLVSISLLLNLIPIDLAQAQVNKKDKKRVIIVERDKRQPPVQVIVQIVATAITLKVIEPWVIPKD
ncbi:MAG: hypothetical protein HC851_01445 [Acaryochloris sp. RU_4_1]|nr:hypothetical protein [Acaryochloris sp. RU_4_1]NJR53499.1 hypothetical protein [Acaryochloris sp. CRU_2_0]